MRGKTLVAGVLALLLFAACSGKKEKELSPAEQKLEETMEQLSDVQYLDTDFAVDATWYRSGMTVGLAMQGEQQYDHAKEELLINGQATVGGETGSLIVHIDGDQGYRNVNEYPKELDFTDKDGKKSKEKFLSFQTGGRDIATTVTEEKQEDNTLIHVVPDKAKDQFLEKQLCYPLVLILLEEWDYKTDEVQTTYVFNFNDQLLEIWYRIEMSNKDDHIELQAVYVPKSINQEIEITKPDKSR